MKKTTTNLFDKTLWKFILVGIANTIVGTGIMFLFYNVLHLNYWFSSASNYFFGSVLSYFLNRNFTFKNQGNSGKSLLKFIINIGLCYLLAYGLAKPAMRIIFKDFPLTWQENLAMLIGMCLFVGLNYLGQRFWVFKNANLNS